MKSDKAFYLAISRISEDLQKSNKKAVVHTDGKVSLICKETKKLITQVQFKGRILDFQSSDVGSNPITRFKFKCRA